MAQFIKIQVEETYQIPDEWELVTNVEGITKIKVKDNEFYDFGSMPYCSASVEDDEEMMLTAEEFIDLQSNGLDILMANTNISVIDNEDEIKEILAFGEE
ncbi:MAG: hypothetical protein WA945_02965 [Arcobacteraceae bacterium]